MIQIKLPEYQDLDKVRVKLDKPRQIVFKDGRNASSSQTTLLPETMHNYSRLQGVYIICIDDEVKYVGATTDFMNRMNSHAFLRNNPKVKFVYFYELDNKSKRLLYEMIYKFHYFGKVNVEWNYRK